MLYLITFCLTLSCFATSSFAQTDQIHTAKISWVEGQSHFDAEFEDGQTQRLKLKAPKKHADLNPALHFLVHYVGWTMAQSLALYFNSPVIYEFINVGGGAFVAYIGFIDAVKLAKRLYHNLNPSQKVQPQ